MKKRFILSVLLLLSILTHSQNSEQDCESARQKYLQQNPDVARAGMNAWTHYTTFGKKEGRKWPKCDNSEAQNELYNESDNNIYNSASVEVKPNYPGGLDNFYNFFLKNFQVQNEEELKGKVFVTFVVEKDGSLTDIKVLRDIGYGTGKEAVRILKSCPRWNCGEQNGKKVRVLYSLPITIEIGPTKELTKSNDSTQNLSQCISGDCVNGKGVSIRPTGNKYEGEFKNEKMEGKGTYFFTNGDKYEGDFKNNTNEGEGIFYYANGDRYEGEFKNGAMEGEGTYYYNSGAVFVGFYKNNKKEGVGEYSIPGLMTIKGNFINGNMEGEGIATLIDGRKYIGNFRNNSPDGFGKEYNEKGVLIYEGEYKDGVKVGSNSTSFVSTTNNNIDLSDSENEEKIRKIIYKVTIDKIVKKDKSNSKVIESRVIKKVEDEILMRKATQKDIADIKKNIKYTADLLQLSAAITPKPKVKCDWCNKKIIGKGFNYEVRDGACWISDIYINNYGFDIFCSREHAYKHCNSRN